MNLGIFGGRIGRDAERKQLQGGDTVANFPLAVDVGTKADPKTMWVDCSIWGKRADGLAPYLVKGCKVTVSGRVIVEEFKKKTGDLGYRLHLNVAEVDLHGLNQGGGSQATNQAAARQEYNENDTPF